MSGAIERREYWRQRRRLTLALPWRAKEHEGVSQFGGPLGFTTGAQETLIVYLASVGICARRKERHDRRLGDGVVDEPAAAGRGAAGKGDDA